MPENRKVYKFIMGLYKDESLLASAIFYVLMETRNGVPTQEIESGDSLPEPRFSNDKMFNAKFSHVLNDISGSENVTKACLPFTLVF